MIFGRRERRRTDDLATQAQKQANPSAGLIRDWAVGPGVIAIASPRCGRLRQEDRLFDQPVSR